MNKGFTMLELLIYTALAIVLGAFLYRVSSYKLDKNTLDVGNANCEHDYVITSKYDWLFEQYKTISKCTKCGKEI